MNLRYFRQLPSDDSKNRTDIGSHPWPKKNQQIQAD